MHALLHHGQRRHNNKRETAEDDAAAAISRTTGARIKMRLTALLGAGPLDSRLALTHLPILLFSPFTYFSGQAGVVVFLFRSLGLVQEVAQADDEVGLRQHPLL